MAFLYAILGVGAVFGLVFMLEEVFGSDDDDDFPDYLVPA